MGAVGRKKESRFYIHSVPLHWKSNWMETRQEFVYHCHPCTIPAKKVVIICQKSSCNCITFGKQSISLHKSNRMVQPHSPLLAWELKRSLYIFFCGEPIPWESHNLSLDVYLIFFSNLYHYIVPCNPRSDLFSPLSTYPSVRKPPNSAVQYGTSPPKAFRVFFFFPFFSFHFLKGKGEGGLRWPSSFHFIH